ncbi:hypothetical protein PFISCL1PPCAC_13969, partial [Pristionchus fissidentatus]
AMNAAAHIAFNWSMAVLSLASNLLLVYLVRKVKVVAMGNYTILIYISALMDVFIAFTNAVVVPVNIHMGKYSFVVFGEGTWQWPAVPGLISIYVFGLLFYQTFAILAFHFVYRYVIVQKSSPLLARLTMRHWTLLGVVFEIFYNVAMAFFLSHYEPRIGWKPDDRLVSDMSSYYGINMSRPFGHFHVVYAEIRGSSGAMTFNWPIVTYTLSIFGLISMLIMVMLVCAKGVLQMMKVLSSVFQTVFPIALSFAPVGCLVLLPLTGRTFGALGNYLMSMGTVFPAIDPLLMIACVQR